MKRILTVIGVRPQFIKAAAFSRVCTSRPGLSEILVHTGQHYDEGMNEIFFRELSIPEPKYHLNVGAGLQGEQTGKMIERLEKVMVDEKPDLVIVYGDTNSTLAGAIAAGKLRIPIAHIEAGLRSFNRWMPEEINRTLVDHASDLLFAPTETAIRNLANEGIKGDKVIKSGDIMFDGALHFATISERESKILSNLNLTSKKFVLASVHRAENTDSKERLSAIIQGIRSLSKYIPVVLPLHPRTRRKMEEFSLSLQDSDSLIVCEPLGYLDMIMLQRNSALIATDSGGVQKEAFFFSVRCATLRAETEWVELVDAGWNKLIDPVSPEAVEMGLLSELNSPVPESKPDLYGDGRAGERILESISAYLK